MCQLTTFLLTVQIFDKSKAETAPRATSDDKVPYKAGVFSFADQHGTAQSTVDMTATSLASSLLAA